MGIPTRARVMEIGLSLAKFALVGGVGFVVDLAVFNVLRAGPLSPEAVAHGPLLAKVVSTLAAIVTNWLGNRYWTSSRAGEFVEFLVSSVATMPVGLLCLWVSHYLMGFTSQLADNVSGLIVGTVLGSIARYLLYRHWVFRAAPVEA